MLSAAYAIFRHTRAKYMTRMTSTRSIHQSHSPSSRTKGESVQFLAQIIFDGSTPTYEICQFEYPHDRLVYFNNIQILIVLLCEHAERFNVSKVCNKLSISYSIPP